MIGADYYDTPAAIVQPTLTELLATLSNDQKLAVLTAFCSHPVNYERCIRLLRHDHGVRMGTASYLWGKLEAVENGCKRVMTGNWEISPAELDGDGNEINPAVYADIPANITALRTFIKTYFTGGVDDFSASHIDIIVGEIVKASRYDGTGDFAFYAENVTL